MEYNSPKSDMKQQLAVFGPVYICGNSRSAVGAKALSQAWKDGRGITLVPLSTAHRTV